ncbi:cytochrome b6-F complex iron-sulfur subunit [Candidatus Magnetobacterium bavaricum]|uniref:Cytochrome b6-F complex iron-sulfur subunit n=1 Tax=Candidatus Magnetobacterium bavaricum TaxID=29290 RepID=A0A0F3GZZ1_9BACT|nr:cytochrome b6-F complex iron-sulfur subunit [Candidatus Magnetobacterium bavaricum]
MRRRDFLRRAVKAFFVSIAFLSSSLAALFIYPARVRQKEITMYECLSEEELPRRGVRRLDIEIDNKGRRAAVFIVAHADKRFALSPVCTHLGCLVSFSRHNNAFICPCHGGKYDVDGNVIEGPPPQPLTRLPMRVDNGKVYIGLKV